MTTFLTLVLFSVGTDAALTNHSATWAAYGLPAIPDSVVLGEISPGDHWLDRGHKALALLERVGDGWAPWSACVLSPKQPVLLGLRVKALDPKALTPENVLQRQVFSDRWGMTWFADFYPEIELAVFLEARGNPRAAAAAARLARNSHPWESNRLLRPRDYRRAVACNAFAYWMRRYVEADARPAAEEAARRLLQVLPDLPTSALPAARRNVDGILARLHAVGSASGEIGRHLDLLLDAPIGSGAWQNRPEKTSLRSHPSYRALVAMGLPAVPSLLRLTADSRLGRVHDVHRRRNGPAILTSVGELAAMLVEESLMIPVPRTARDHPARARSDFVTDVLARKAMFSDDEAARQAAHNQYATSEREAYERLAAAIKKKDAAPVEKLLSERPWLASHPENPIVDAVNYSLEAEARRLFACGADPNATWNPDGSPSSPFARTVDCAGYSRDMWRRQKRRAELLGLVQDMAALGADPTARSPRHVVTAIEGALQTKDEEVASVLAAHTPVDANLGGYGPLHAAAFYGNPRVLAQLLAAGADPEMRTAGGESTLDLAVRADQPKTNEVVELLIKSGAKQALYHAAALGDLSALGRLLDAGADPNARDEALGLPPVAWAAGHERLRVLDALEKKGAALRVKVGRITARNNILPAFVAGEVEADLGTRDGRAKAWKVFHD